MINLGDLNIEFSVIDEKTANEKARNTKSDKDFKPLPAGKYAAKVVKGEIKKSEKTGSTYMNVDFVLIGGKGVNKRRVFDMLGLDHPRIKEDGPRGWVRNGLKKLEVLAKQVGKKPSQIKDFNEDLAGVEVTLVLKIVEAKDGFKAKNEVQYINEFDEDLTDKSIDDEDIGF